MWIVEIIPPSRPFRFFFDPLDELEFLSLLFQRISILFMDILFSCLLFISQIEREKCRVINQAHKIRLFLFRFNLPIDTCKSIRIAFFFLSLRSSCGITIVHTCLNCFVFSAFFSPLLFILPHFTDTHNGVLCNKHVPIHIWSEEKNGRRETIIIYHCLLIRSSLRCVAGNGRQPINL